ncbi:hypothetical protein K461DRAFT_273034 [Myriangium duriaei CBS 260.36]|uniref:Uncharacterized protein n=1 Tax=Myriangium duriaei CBS 260.36 TaxID=1168546 RepID=A0A9P4JBD7_9PEZI|nr:hypothetical protein K461DRAFT_273034 [Myriangium duriaei CBS 260.36]
MSLRAVLPSFLPSVHHWLMHPRGLLVGVCPLTQFLASPEGSFAARHHPRVATASARPTGPDITDFEQRSPARRPPPGSQRP